MVDRLAPHCRRAVVTEVLPPRGAPAAAVAAAFGPACPADRRARPDARVAARPGARRRRQAIVLVAGSLFLVGALYRLGGRDGRRRAGATQRSGATVKRRRARGAVTAGSVAGRSSACWPGRRPRRRAQAIRADHRGDHDRRGVAQTTTRRGRSLSAEGDVLIRRGDTTLRADTGRAQPPDQRGAGARRRDPDQPRGGDHGRRHVPRPRQRDRRADTTPASSPGGSATR